MTGYRFQLPPGPEPVISDAGPGSGVSRPELRNRYSFEWGLASLLMGGLLLLCGFLALQLNLQLFLSPDVWSSGDLRVLQASAMFGGFGIIGLSFLSVCCSLRSLVMARRADQPMALGLCGLLAGCLALLMWLGVTIDLLAVIRVLSNR